MPKSRFAGKNFSEADTSTGIKSRFAGRTLGVVPVKLEEDYQKALNEKIGFDSLQKDLESMGKTIQGIYDGWQTQDTMKKTKPSVESMYNRLIGLQDYRKQHGITNGDKEIGEMVDAYGKVLEDWDKLTGHYGNYKNADEYNSLYFTNTQDFDLNAVYQEAKRLKEKADKAGQGLLSKKGMPYIKQKKESDAAKEELNAYLSQYGYKNFLMARIKSYADVKDMVETHDINIRSIFACIRALEFNDIYFSSISFPIIGGNKRIDYSK